MVMNGYKTRTLRVFAQRPTPNVAMGLVQVELYTQYVRSGSIAVRGKLSGLHNIP